jgi:hypothetical protein
VTFTIDDLESSAFERQNAARRRKAAAIAAARQMLGQAQARGQTHLTASEERGVDGLLADRDRASEELARIDRELASIGAARTEMASDAAAYAQISPAQLPARPERRTASVSVGRNERTYRPDTDPSGRNFLLDVARNFLHADPAASARLAQHMNEERLERPGYAERVAGDTTTSNWAGLVVPAYLTGLVADQIAALRPFADLCCVPVNLPPNGMTVNFSKVTTGSSVALQATELTGVSATSLDDTLGSSSVQTAAGMQNISRQAIERGTGIEETTWRDLARKYASTLDSTLINQAVNGLTNVAQTVTYTSASPTAAEFYPFIYQGASRLEAALLGVAYPSHVVMHSRRWNWFAAGLTNTLPIVSSGGVPPQSAGFSLNNGQGGDPPSVRAILASGLKVVVDNNIPVNLGAGTNQDEVYIVASSESMYLAEDPNAPMMIRAEQPNAAQLGVLLVLYSYFAYFTRYANPASKLSGTGLVGPAGF